VSNLSQQYLLFFALSKALINQYLMSRAKSFIVVILCFGCHSVVHGAEWSINTAVKQDLSYDDNVFMTEDKEGSMAYKIIPVLNFLHKTDVSEVKAYASYGTQYYEGVAGLNQDLQDYGVNGNYSTERATWVLASNFNVAPARNTAVQDSGIFASTAQKTSWSIAPSFSYKLTELDSLQLSPSYSETTYSTNEFSSNKNQNINLGWQRQWTKRYINVISVFYLHNEFGNSNQITGRNQVRINPGISGNGGTYDSYGVNFSNKYLWSEKWELNGVIGVQQTASETSSFIGLVQKSSSVGFLTDSNISYKGENLSAQLFLQRSLVPSSQGQLQDLSSVGLNINYKITERIWADFSSGYQLSKFEATSTRARNNTSRQNINLNPSINWNITRDWTLSGSYRYRIQLSENQDAVDSNLFMLSVNYNWQGLSFSR
jgi:hypothetical protein